MGRPTKYPQVLQLAIGQAVIIPLAQVDSLVSLRVSMSTLAQRHGIKLEVHLNARKDEVEIARVSNEPVVDNLEVRPAIRRGYMTKEERKVLMDEAWQKHLASFADEEA